MSNFVEIKPTELKDNFFDLISNRWALITTKKDNNSYNTMTASWGGAGFIWNKPVVFVFIRPQRYTFSLIEKNENFSLSFLDSTFKDKLGYCGKVSGRDEDKIKTCGFTTPEINGAGIIGEAEIAITCKKLYSGDILKDGFIDTSLLSNYPSNDFHKMYIGEITGIYIKNDI